MEEQHNLQVYQTIKSLFRFFTLFLVSKSIFIAGKIPACNTVWILGDDFVANTYDQYVKNAVRKEELYMKVNYDLESFAKKRSDSNIKSVLARIKFQLIRALNEHALLPKSIIILLDDDIIRRVEVKADREEEIDGLSAIFTRVIKWLVNQVDRAILSRKEQLPEKSKEQNSPVCYWVEAPQHVNFNNNNLSCRKFNSSLQAETSIKKNMRVMRMKKKWDPEDPHSYLSESSRFTSTGIFKYWASIDNALEFNDKKKDEFLLKNQNPKAAQDRSKFKWYNNHRKQYSQENQDYRFRLP